MTGATHQREALNSAIQREALRQQQLLRTLWRRSTDATLNLWLRESGGRAVQGIAAYRGNAAAIAERALAAAYPTVQQLVGDESFAQLAHAVWHRFPPQRGDLAQFGAALPAWVELDPQLASEPYLADVARIDWAVHAIEQAADIEQPPAGLVLLGEMDPAQLRLRLRPGLALVASKWPVVTVWLAHRRDPDDGGDDRFAPVRAAFAAQAQETALIARRGWRAEVDAIDAPTAAFIAALQRGADLADALEGVGAALAFDRWLQRALTNQWLQAVEPVAATRGST
jgi:hypothetical protein